MALYDPQEFPETKVVSPDFTVADVLAWARTKPEAGRYDYGDINGCALCQFLAETGRAVEPEAGGFTWDDASLPRVHRPIPGAVADTLWPSPNTFGAFADRLEKALSC